MSEASANYADAVLPSNDTFFAFDGTNSDLARQLFLRAKTGANAPQFKGLSVPSAVQDRLDGLGLSWDDLPGVAQRAVLWDSGFGVTPTNEAVRIRTLSGHAMTDLAVPLAQFQAVGCVEQNCSQPDNTTSWSNLYCNGDQMLSASRCVVEDFTDKSGIHLALWMTGGNPKVVPAPTVRKHVWTDDSSGIQYNVVAVHTLDLDDEPAYDECPEKSQNGGYGSLVLPCYTTADVSGAINSD
ncbi:TKL protein kinase [Phytophthora cinnamomi]|uniref:TKL protein kinase n=1 Tax=Phytophthora cinnamomi TaxID=4785 RepID=UPI00355A8801|nr:TKL protein kinase [Phytophthora cinnamomi]